MAADHKLLMAARRDGNEDGYSLTSNFVAQKSWADEGVLPILDQALEQVVLPADESAVFVANLGCLSRADSIFHVNHIVKQLSAKILAAANDVNNHSDDNSSLSSTTREFEVYFNLLPSNDSRNDYNTLFQIMSNNNLIMSNESQQQQQQQTFFASSIPGSLYRRLFVRSKIHLFFSSLALQVLSRIPDGVVDRESPAFNKGNLWLHGASSETVQAYRDQGATDLKEFLHARAAELTRGGLLCFSLLARTSLRANDLEEIDEDAFAAAIRCLHEASLEGILTPQELDVLNLPVYIPRFEEIMDTIKSFSSTYEIVAAKEVKCRPFPFLCAEASSATISNGDSNGSDHALSFREVFLRICKCDFGRVLGQVADKKRVHAFWDRFLKIAREKYIRALSGTCVISVVALIKKST